MKLDLWARLTKLGLSGKSVACCMSSYLVLGGFVTVIEHRNNDITVIVIVRVLILTEKWHWCGTDEEELKGYLQVVK